MVNAIKVLPNRASGPSGPFRDNPIAEEAYFQQDPGGVVRLTFNMLQDMGLAHPGTQATNAIGLTIVFAVGTGFMAFKRAQNAYAKAEQLGDKEGMEMARATMARGITEVIGGAEFTPYRILGMSHHQAGSTIIKVQTWLARAGLLIFSALYALLSVPSWMVLGQKRRFWKKLETKKGDLTQLEYLKQYVNPKIEKKHLVRAFKAVSVNGPIAIDVTDLARLPVDLMEKVNAYVAPIFKAMNLEGAEHQEYREFLVNKMVRNLLTRVYKREAKLTRIIGGEAVEQLRLSKDDLKLEEVVKAGSKKTTMMHVAIIIACLVGIIAFTAANLSTGGLPADVLGGIAGAGTLIFLSRSLYKARSKVHWKALATIVTVSALLAAFVALEMVHGGTITTVGDGLMAMTSFSMLLIDGYFLKQAMKAHSPDKKMRMMLLAISALTVLFGLIGMMVANSRDSLVMAGITTGIWTVTGAASYYFWKKRSQDVSQELREKKIVELKQNPFPQHLPTAV